MRPSCLSPHSVRSPVSSPLLLFFCALSVSAGRPLPKEVWHTNVSHVRVFSFLSLSQGIVFPLNPPYSFAPPGVLCECAIFPASFIRFALFFVLPPSSIIKAPAEFSFSDAIRLNPATFALMVFGAHSLSYCVCCLDGPFFPSLRLLPPPTEISNCPLPC